MFEKKEITAIIVIALVLGLITSLLKEAEIFFYTTLLILIVVFINATAKKIAGFYLESEIRVRIWEMYRWGFKPKMHFKKPFLMGAFLPIIIKILSMSYLNWMACLVFDVKPKSYRAAKRHGTYAFSEMTEWHIGLIASIGILANLAFSVLGYLVGLTEFARLNLYYAAFNLIPFSDLDGNKIFFGNLIWWAVLAAITFIGLGYAFLGV